MLFGCAALPELTQSPAPTKTENSDTLRTLASATPRIIAPATTPTATPTKPAASSSLTQSDLALQPAGVGPTPAPAAAALPPLDVERQDVRDTQRGVAKVDRTTPPDDLWERIRGGFGMPNLDTPIVQDRTAWYAARPEYLKRTFERSRRYLFHIVDELEKRGMPTEIALLPMVESSFNPMAYSRAHASGLWQFIPGTGKRYDLTQNWWFDGRRDIVASTSAALDYLKTIYDMHGDWHLALASYNWGEHAVARAIERNKAAGLPTDYANLTMPNETRYYVPKLQALKNIIANPAPFGIVLDPIPNQPYFATITKTRDIDVKLAAQLAEMSVEEFIALNPGFNRPIIPVAISARIVLPADKVETFHANLLKHDKALVSWKTYTPVPGEKLEAVAKKFNLPLARLKEVNGIGAKTRGTPSVLVVPLNGATLDTARLPLMYAPPIPVARNTTPAVHTVKSGETLASIATRYGVSIDDLKRWNQIGRVTPGQHLKVQAPRSAHATDHTHAVQKPSKKTRHANKKPAPVRVAKADKKKR